MSNVLMTQSNVLCDSYIKALIVPQAQMMFGCQGINIKMVNCPVCGKEFNRKFNMERHRIVIHGDSNSKADTEESFDGNDHDTEVSDEHDSSNEEESIADEGDNDDDDDNSDEEEDEGDDDNSSSDSQSSTDDEDDDDSVWSGMRDFRVSEHVWWQKCWIGGGRHVSQWCSSGSLQMCTTEFEMKHHHELYGENHGKQQTSSRPYTSKNLDRQTKITRRWQLWTWRGHEICN